MRLSVLGLGVLFSLLLLAFKFAGVGEMPQWSVAECFWPLLIAVIVMVGVLLFCGLLMLLAAGIEGGRS